VDAKEVIFVLRTKQEQWEELVRIAARKNREAVAKVLGKKPERRSIPMIQHARPTKN